VDAVIAVVKISVPPQRVLPAKGHEWSRRQKSIAAGMEPFRRASGTVKNILIIR
jgi:hypothetical protein